MISQSCHGNDNSIQILTSIPTLHITYDTSTKHIPIIKGTLQNENNNFPFKHHILSVSSLRCTYLQNYPLVQGKFMRQSYKHLLSHSQQGPHPARFSLNTIFNPILFGYFFHKETFKINITINWIFRFTL